MRKPLRPLVALLVCVGSTAALSADWQTVASDKKRTIELDRASVLQSDVHKRFHGRFTKRERMLAALQRLQANGCLRHTTKKNAGARASDVWLVNPRVFS